MNETTVYVSIFFLYISLIFSLFLFLIYTKYPYVLKVENHLGLQIVCFYLPFFFMDPAKCLDSINGAVKFSAISLSQLSRVFSSIGQRSVMATKYGFFMHACVVTSRHILSMYLWPGTIMKTFNECFKYYDFVGSIQTIDIETYSVFNQI